VWRSYGYKGTEQDYSTRFIIIVLAATEWGRGATKHEALEIQKLNMLWKSLIIGFIENCENQKNWLVFGTKINFWNLGEKLKTGRFSGLSVGF
jgi:hypothetical protein